MTCDQSFSQSHVGSGSKGRFVMYTDADGQWALKLGGSKSWRNNNPGNLRYGTFAKNHGAIGRDKDGMAIFPDVATGAAAKKSLITGPVYNNGDMSIHDFINKYAPPSENDTVAYEAYIKKQLDITDTSATKINDVNVDKLLDVLKRREGWIPGTEESGLPTDQCAEPPPLPQPTSNIDDIKKKVAKASVTRSPIALDLNGDGITTTALTDGAYFDHDGNGFAEQTGWVNPDDGILVRDLDGNGTIDNGRELFGSETLLANGQKAANGYAALAELDTNHDGQIDVQDAAYSTLKIWKDTDGDGYSNADELFTLAEAGVQSIATGYTAVNQTDANGNTVKQTSTFTKTDGSTGATADIWFQTDKTYTIANDWLAETDIVAALPDLEGFGNVYDLHQAILRDSTGHLQDLVQQFIAETDPAARHALTTQLIYAWVGVENIDPASRAARIIYGNVIGDARKLATLEAILGEPYLGTWCWGERDPNPHGPASKILLQAFNEFADSIYNQLMAQTHLQPLIDTIGYTWNATTLQYDWDVSATVTALQAIYDADPANSILAISEFANVLKQSDSNGLQVLDALRAKGDATGTGFAQLLAIIGLDTTLGDAGNNTLRGSKARCPNLLAANDLLWWRAA